MATKKNAQPVESQTPPVEPVNPETPTPEAKPFVFDEWAKDLQPEAVEGLNKYYHQYYTTAIEKEYGDFIPVIEEIKADPELRKKFGKLSDKELRTFLFNNAMEAYDTVSVNAPVETPPARDPELVKEVEDLKTQFKTKQEEEVTQKYVASRNQEFQALANEVPELRYTRQANDDPAWRLAEHVVNVAHKRTLESNYQKIVPFKEVWDEYCELAALRNAPQQHAPATSRSGPPPQTQAPASPKEAKQRMLETLQRSGGWANFSKE